MFGSLGFPELVFIFVLALLVFGPKKLPELGKTVGKALGEFRRATSDLKSSFEAEVDLDERRSRAPREPRAPRPQAVEPPKKEPVAATQPSASTGVSGDKDPAPSAPSTAEPTAKPGPTRSFSTARGALAPPDPSEPS